ncbi:uncharacterized protein LOC134279333 [Saccostrea cucullata]|uniref:uncharacterized protein LOC134279333 n=1 Tax=Saccostrea cuccullata TaxID=36930 RepID=UPI002ED1B4C1
MDATYSICNVLHSSICGREDCHCSTRKGKKTCQSCDVWCDRTESVECYHGNCNSLGCQCEPCYTGDRCNIYTNLYAPEYVHRTFVAKVETFSRGVLRGVAAIDQDSSSCAEAGYTQCYCSRVIHRLMNVSSNIGEFKINHDTGDLSYDVMTEDVIVLNIAAYNYDEFGYPDIQDKHIGHAKVKIYVTDKAIKDLETHLFIMENVPNIYNWRVEDFEEETGMVKNSHHRYKRQASSIPGNVTADMTLTSGEIVNVTPDVYFYNFLPISLTISFPEGSSFLSAKINSDKTGTNSPMFFFCDPDVTFVGSNFFGWNPDQYSTILTSSDDPQVKDMLEVDLGIVTNDGSDTTIPEANDIIIEYFAYVMDPADTLFDQPIKIFADIVWNNSTWMTLEKEFIIRNFANAPSDPLITVDGPSSLNPGVVGTWTVKTFVLHPHADLSVEIFGTMPSSVDLCSASYVGQGDAYKCNNISQISKTPSGSGSGGYLFSLGKIFNTDYNVSADAEKYFTFLVYGEIATSAVIGQNYSFTVNVDVSGITYTYQYSVTASGAAIPQAPGTPILSLLPRSSTIYQGGKETIDVELTTIVNQTEAYLITIMNPTPTNELVHICDVSLGSVGNNIMCGVNTFNPTYVSTENNNLNDKVSINLGIITNVALDAGAVNSTVSVSVTICYVSTGNLNPGDIITINGELQHGSVIDSPQSTAVTVIAGTPTISAPAITLTYGNGYSNILPRGRAVYDLSLILSPSTYYENINVSFNTGNDIIAKTSICSISVIVTGNVTCRKVSPAEYINNAARVDMHDSGYVYLGSLENSGNHDVTITALAVISLLDTTVVDGDPIITNASVTYNTDGLWEGYISSTVNSVNSYPSSTIHYSLTSPQPIAVSNRGAAEFELSAELPIGVITHLQIVVTAVHTELSICSIYIKFSGLNIPCASHGVTVTNTKYSSGGGNSAVTFNVPSVTNSGESPSASDSTIKFGIVALVREGYDFPNLGSSYFDLNIEHIDEWTTGTKAASIYVNASNVYSTATPILQIDYPSGGNAIKGSTVAVNVKVYTSPNSNTDYKMDFTPTTIGKMHVCDVKIFSRRKHVCIDNVASKTFVTSSDNSTYESASIDIGNVINWGPDGSTQQQDPNMFIVQVTLAIENDASISVGESLSCSIVLSHSVSQTVSDSATLTVVPTPDSVNTNIGVTSNPPSAGVVYASISEFVKWGVKLELPRTTDRYTMTLIMPTSAGEAHLTVVNASHVASEIGIGCSQNTTVGTTLTSDLSTTQMTQMTVDLGVLSNTDDLVRVVEFAFTFQVTDHSGNTDGSVQTFNITVQGDNGGFATTTGSVTIQVDGTETAQLEFDTWTDPLPHTHRFSGHELKLYGTLNLVNTSKAHASSVVVHFLLPPYTSLVALNEWTVLQPSVAVTATGGVDLTYPLIKFTDFPTFSLNLTIDPNTEFESGRMNIHTVIPAEVSYLSLQRPDRADIAEHNTLLDIVEFGFNSEVCNKIIGTDTTAISDSQISASSEENLAFNLKKSSGTGWRPKKRGKPFCQNEFVTVHFIDKVKIIAFSVLSAGNDNDDYVTNMTVQYSDDGIFWTYVTDNSTEIKSFIVAFDDSTKTVNDAYRFSLDDSEIFTAAYVRIIPTSGKLRSCDPVIRVEFEGCKTSTNNVSSTAMSSPNFPLSERFLLTDTIAGTMFACIKSGIEGDNTCSRSVDNGTSWEEMNDIGQVLGVKNRTTLVGISQDGMANLCSDDKGVTWVSCQGVDVTEITSDSTYTPGIPQPFDDFSAVTDDTMYFTYGFSHQDFDVTGTMSGVKVRHLGGSWSSVAWWGSSDWSLI